MNFDSLRLIVCGTGTDIGKTVVSSFLVQGLNGMYWKPIQSGLEGGGDMKRVRMLLGLSKERCIPENYKFKAPVSPHWAAELEGQVINPDSLIVPPTKEPLVIEMAGGVMVPLTRTYLQIDLLEQWMLPIVLVARSELGTLNHTLLTIEALNKRRIPILGLILNGPFHKDNPRTLEEFGKVPVIARLPTFSRLSKEGLAIEWKKQELKKQLTTLLNNF